MQCNLQKTRVKIDGRLFEFRFWDDCELGISLPYSGVYEIRAVEKKRLFSRRPYIKEEEKTINYGWGADDRVKWCYEVMERLLAEEKRAAVDLEKIRKFCERPLIDGE